MNPRGRDAGVWSYDCCDNYRKDVNPRHLWHEHDSTRHYHDPVGWQEHEASCSECRGDGEVWVDTPASADYLSATQEGDAK